MKRRDFLRLGIGAGSTAMLGAEALYGATLPAWPDGLLSSTRRNTLPLEDIRLLPGPFQAAQDTDKAYLLELEPDRLLAWMRQTAGLPAKAAHYGGWDSGGSGMIGHYLSAISQMAQATGDAELRRRVGYIAAEMAAVQAANGDGGLYDSPASKDWFGKLAQGQVIPENTTPWYVTHKAMAGARDAWLRCGDQAARAVLVRVCDWCSTITSRLTDAQWQEMLGSPDMQGEFGGPHEVLADTSVITADPKYLRLAEKFRHNIIFDPLAAGEVSVLDGKHANTEIPKFVGYQRIGEVSGEPIWQTAARNFWNNVTGARSWANGGNSQWEHFFAADTYSSQVLQPCGPESCNTYNMLKLTRMLFLREPSVHYADYYEHALLNHILPSVAPDKGGFVYYTSQRPGHYRVFSRPFDAFWCCVGTGMENHGKYGEMIYAADGDSLYVNLFIPSVLNWKAQGVTVRQETTFPEEDRTRLTLTMRRPRRLTLRLRCPGWVEPDAMRVHINGQLISSAIHPGSYVDVTRVWKTGDVVEMQMPMRLRAEPLPQTPDRTAFLYGPVLLAGPQTATDLREDDFYGGGDNFDSHNQLASQMIPLTQTSQFVGTAAEAVAAIRPVPGRPLTFRTHGRAKPKDIPLVPFYRVFFQRYTLYWLLQTPAAYAEAQALDAQTVDQVQIGDPASEAAHGFQSDGSRTGPASDPQRHWRDASGWLSYTLELPAGQPAALHCTYWGSDTGRTFDILVDSVNIATQSLTGQHPNRNFSVNYPLPLSLTQGKTRVTVRFQPTQGGLAGGIFGCRMLKEGAEHAA